jgi:raffinose/stachyose/melibiose transport system permease protein
MGTFKPKPQYALYLLPALALYVVFFIGPFAQTMGFSLTKWDGINDSAFIGLGNYLEMFREPVFQQSLVRVLKWALIQAASQIGIALFVANLLRASVRGAVFFRSVFFIPVVISSAAICLMFVVMYDNDIGLVNTALRLLGLERLTHIWLGEQSTAFYAAIVVPIWQGLGMYIVILVSGLQGLPEEVYESSMLDGANAWQRFWRITLPMLWPIVQVCVILSVSGAFKNFDYIYILTAGGPGSSTHVLATYMYDKAFVGLRFGYGSAVAVVIFALGMMFTMGFKLLTTREN